MCAVVTPFEHGGGHDASQGKVTRNWVVLSSCGFTFSSLRHLFLWPTSQAPLMFLSSYISVPPLEESLSSLYRKVVFCTNLCK